MPTPRKDENKQTPDEKLADTLSSLDAIQKKRKRTVVATKNSISKVPIVGIFIIIIIVGVGLLSFADLGILQPESGQNSLIGKSVTQKDFSFQLLDNSTVRLSNYVGEPIVLDFFATWCTPCIEFIPVLKQVRSVYPDLHILSVSASLDDDLPLIASFKTDHKMDWIVGFDYTLSGATKYQVNSIPTLVFINSQGIIRHWEVGALTSFNDISRWIQQG